MEASLRSELEEHLSGWGARLDASQWDLLGAYLADLLEYNRKVNLTAASDPAEVVRRHFADGLAALSPLRARLGPAPHLADVGSGGGFVGLCLKIAWPEAAVTLIESAYRKYCFLNWEATRLALRGLRVHHGRAERLARGGFDAVLARALAPLPEAVALTWPLASPSGLAVIYQSSAPDPVEPALLKALEKAGARVAAVEPYRLPGEREERNLVIISRRHDRA